MQFDMLEYVGLRIIRRYFFTPSRLKDLSRYLPYYRVNQGETDPWAIAEAYAADLARIGQTLAGKRVLEIGSGAANGAGYAMVAMGATRVVCHEPYAPFDVGLDAKHLAGLVARFPKVKFSVVDRRTSLDGLTPGAFDIVLSNSVLEHVAEPKALFTTLARLLAPEGVMIHRVDYRDHFFKYPFHFLLFSKFVWKWFLNPGDLPRWHFDDHLSYLALTGFDATALDVRRDPEAFAAVADRLHPDFRRRDPEMLSVTGATVAAGLRRPGGATPLLDLPTGGHDAPRTPSSGN